MALIKENPYIPHIAKIRDFKEEAPDVRTFKLIFKDQRMANNFSIKPGQFIELTVFGYGEAPFSVSSYNLKGGEIELTIRKIGNLTRALFNMRKNEEVGIRGPFGRGWPLEDMKGENLLIIAGGIGIAPLKPLIEYVINERNLFGDVTLLYGARTPKDIVYKKELEGWKNYIDVHLTVDKADEKWRGRTGVVTVLLEDVKVNPSETYSLQCGPPIMMHFVTKKLIEMGFQHERIFLSLERLMKCGMGFCGHCMIGGKFVCKDGPVFGYNEIIAIPEPAI
ncbi:MAG TPA: oxidoreductase [Thermofilum sp.]|nr:oxidoreductase [Thermofilum sp.]